MIVYVIIWFEAVHADRDAAKVMFASACEAHSQWSEALDANMGNHTAELNIALHDMMFVSSVVRSESCNV